MIVRGELVKLAWGFYGYYGQDNSLHRGHPVQCGVLFTDASSTCPVRQPTVSPDTAHVPEKRCIRITLAAVANKPQCFNFLVITSVTAPF